MSGTVIATGSRPFHQRTIGPSAAVAAALTSSAVPTQSLPPHRCATTVRIVPPLAATSWSSMRSNWMHRWFWTRCRPGCRCWNRPTTRPTTATRPARQRCTAIPLSRGSAVIGGPPGSAGRPVEFGLADGFLLKEGDRTWVSIPTEGQDYTQFVVARGVPEDQLVRAAQRRTSAPRRRLLLSTRFRRGWSR